MVFAAAYPIFRNNQILLYYARGKLPHRGMYDAGLCLAILRPEGFAGYESKGMSEVGLVTTRLMSCSGTCLRITADAEGGQLRVNLLDDRNQTVQVSEPIVADVTDVGVKWRGGSDLSEYLGKRARLQFELRNATIYAFSFGE